MTFDVTSPTTLEQFEDVILPTAETNTRDVLPTCQDKCGHVGWNRLRPLCSRIVIVTNL